MSFPCHLFLFICSFFLLKFLQVITQIWVLLLGGLALAGTLDILVGIVYNYPRIHLFWMQIIRSLVAKMFSFTGRAWFPYSFLPCTRWIPAVVYIFCTSFKGSSFKNFLNFFFIFFNSIPFDGIWLSSTRFSS